MSRTANSIETVPIRISTTPPIHDYLIDLVSTGLYGKTPAEAAERLIAAGLESLIDKGTFISVNNMPNQKRREKGN